MFSITSQRGINSSAWCLDTPPPSVKYFLSTHSAWHPAEGAKLSTFQGSTLNYCLRESDSTGPSSRMRSWAFIPFTGPGLPAGPAVLVVYSLRYGRGSLLPFLQTQLGCQHIRRAFRTTRCNHALTSHHTGFRVVLWFSLWHLLICISVGMCALERWPATRM